MTSNRDEHISRGNAVFPDFYHLDGKNLVFPKDQTSGGTWFISNDKGDIGILLNGALEKHFSNPPYRKSRGLILPDIFQKDSPLNAIKQYDFAGIENFTIILWQAKQLWEIKWNGLIVHMTEINPGIAHIWSSVTLYTPEMTKERKNWFIEWCKTFTVFEQDSILKFHTQAQQDNKEYGLQIARPDKITTVSTTSIRVENQQVTLIHKDLIGGIDVSLNYEISNLANIQSPVNFTAVYAQNN